MKKRRRPDTRRADGSAARAAPGRALQASTGQPIPVGTAAGEPGRDRLPRRFRARAALFALLCAACFGIAGGYVALTVWRADAAAGRASAGPVADAGAISMLGQQPRLVFLDSAGDA